MLQSEYKMISLRHTVRNMQRRMASAQKRGASVNNLGYMIVLNRTGEAKLFIREQHKFSEFTKLPSWTVINNRFVGTWSYCYKCWLS